MTEESWNLSYGVTVTGAFVAAVRQSDDALEATEAGNLSADDDLASWLESQTVLVWNRYSDTPVDIDLAPLASCSRLEELSLYVSADTDIAPLGELKNLRRLNLRVGQQNDLSSLQNLESLRELELEGGEFTNWSFLADINDLEELVLKGQRQHLIPAGALDGVKKLSWFAAVSDLGPLASAHGLVQANLESNAIGDLSPLGELSNLRSLNLQSNRIADLTPLASLERLERLNLAENCVVDVTPLRRLHSLGESQVQHILQSPQLDSRHAPMLRILDDWNELSHWACYAQWLQDRDEILGLELQEKLEGKWSQLPEHWAPATEVERRVIEGQWHSRNVSPILRL